MDNNPARWNLNVLKKIFLPFKANQIARIPITNPNNDESWFGIILLMGLTLLKQCIEESRGW